MTLFIIFAIVVFIAVSVVGALFYLLSKESQKEDIKAIPIANPQEFLKVGPSVQEIEYKHRVEELETELRTISEKGAAQSQQAMTMVEELRQENDALKGERFKASQEVAKELETVRLQTTQLQHDNTALQVQLESSQSKVYALQEEAIAIRKRMDVDLTQLQEQLSTQSTSQIAALQETQNRVEILQQEVQELQLTNQKLKELNASLIEKDQLLQNELVKHRVQASGLERLCENYRLELQKRT